MRSPLDIIIGEFDHALFTTFTCNLAFFERSIVPLLSRAHVRNTALFTDADQLGAALADPHVLLAGRRYHVHGVRAKGVFHPKLILLTSPKQARLCVSSANLTVSGQLRNLEIAAAFDTTISGHEVVIAAAAEYFRRLASEAPSHIAEAVFDALAHVTPDETQGDTRFVHNLDLALVDQVPAGPLRTVAPFADSTAAARLAEERDLSVVVDGAAFAAGNDFFTGGWGVEPRQFDRPLHGKAYWSTDGQSALIGSPNLTRPALLQPADSGNYEAAVVFSDLRDGFPAAPSSRWDGDNIRETAARRSALKPFESHPTVPDLQSFSAWEDDGAIALSSVPDGTTIQYGTLTGWHDLGIAQSESVDVPEGVRPHLLRAVIGARTSLAVVHRVGELRTGRLRPRHTRSSGTLSGTLPLDPEDQRILEKVLGDLFALASLVNEKRARTPRLPTPAARESASNTQLSRWLPAQPDDEPRVPDLYRQVWEKSRPVDVLLALARTALRLDDVNPFVSSDELDVSAEMRDIEDLDAEDEAISVESEHDSAPETTRDVLSRYRKAFMRRLSELVKFIAIVDDQDLADLAFQVTLVQHERLTLEVRIDGEIVPLIEPKVLLNQKMELLSVYLGGGGDDPLCMETARYHLAECLRNSDVWNPLQREKLENLAYQHGQRILNTPLPYHPAPELLGMDLDEADGWIESLTNRTDWSAITRHASEYLSDASLHTEPFPYIIGSAAYSKISHAPGREGSPAWDVIGYGAIAGLADKEPYGIGVRNSDNDGPFLVHVLVTEPKRSRLYEAALRRTDEVWIWRYYSPIYRKALEDAAKFGPMALDDAYREPWKDSDLASLPKAVRVLATTTGSIVDQKGY